MSFDSWLPKKNKLYDIASLLERKINTISNAEQKTLEMREEAKKQQQWFEDHLASSAEVAKQAEQILKHQIAGMEDRHEREKQLWADMKLQYEARAQGHTAKINTRVEACYGVPTFGQKFSTKSKKKINIKNCK